MKAKVDILCALAVAAVTFAAFAVACTYGIAFCDDMAYFVGNIYSRGLTLEGVRTALIDGSESIWMPFARLTYMLDHSLGWGFGGMHVQSILWHAANAALFYALLRRLFGRRSAAVVGALFWAVHPLRVESVVWLASRKDVVSAFFLLLGLHAWLNIGSRNWKWLSLSFLCFLLGATAKPSVMVFPVFVLALDFLVTGRRKSVGVYAAAVFLSVDLALFAGQLQAHGSSADTEGIPLWYRAVNALASTTVYLGNTVWPDALAPQCMIRHPDWPRFSPLGSALLVLILCWLFRTVRPRLVACWRSRDPRVLVDGRAVDNVLLASFAIFFGSLVPFLGIVGFGWHAFADRFTILPALGLSMAVACLLSRAGGRTALAVSGIAVAALAVRTHFQTRYWRDDGVLLRHTLEVDRDENAEIQSTLGAVCWDGQDMEEAYCHYRKCYDCYARVGWSPGPRTEARFIDACYETGRDAEADERFRDLREYVREAFGEDKKPLSFRFAELLWTLHSDRPDALKVAEKLLSDAEKTHPDSFLVPYMEFKIARRQDDRPRMIGALKRFRDVKWPICPPPWSLRMLDELLSGGGGE